MSSKKRQEQQERKAKAIAAKSRRKFLTLTGAAGLMALGGYGFVSALSGPPFPAAKTDFDPAAKLYDTDIVYGSADAPVTVVEFASLTCIHCARFHNESLPGFLKRWVETGKARLVYRHFPFDGVALAGANMVSCLKEEARPAAISALMKHRDRWIYADKPAEQALNLLTISDKAAAAAKSCVAEGTKSGVMVEALNEARRAGIASTPTFIVGGNMYAGFMSTEALGAIVDSMN